MRYIESENIFVLSTQEFTKLARLKMPSYTPTEYESIPLAEWEETARHGGAVSFNPDLLSKVSLTGEFNSGGYNFRIEGECYADKEGNIFHFTKKQDIHTALREDLKKEAKGEGYILGYLFTLNSSEERVNLNIIALSKHSSEPVIIKESVEKKKLLLFFNRCKENAHIFALPEIERVSVRTPYMKKLKFPYRKPRQGQLEFMQTVYKNLTRGTTLFATAPTGTGKTVSALYPAVKALGKGKGDKIFYLTPKKTTALAAKKCIEDMSGQAANIRAEVLFAKEGGCQRGLLCRMSKKLCPTTASTALSRAVLKLYSLNISVVTEEDIQKISAEFTVCPYELALSYSELCDIVIADFNHLFDPSVHLRRYFESKGEWLFLIDEAHNLPQRAREMFSAELSDKYIKSLSENPLIGEHSDIHGTVQKFADGFFEILYPIVKDEIRTFSNGEKRGAISLKEVPYQLTELALRAYEEIKSATDTLRKCDDTDSLKRLLCLREYGIGINKFLSAISRFDSSYELFIFCDDTELRAKIFCIDPGKELSQCIDSGKSAVYFSATLTPIEYYRCIMGADRTSDSLEVLSPFTEEQLSVSIVDNISTRLFQREDTLMAVLRIIAASVSPKRGNYMVFCPSFSYAKLIHGAFKQKYPRIKALLQKQEMTQEEKTEFLDAFRSQSGAYLVGFCVLGGIFSEGIDLTGESLIGAVVIGTGLPSVSYEGEAVSAFYQEKYERGKEFAYICPGINKVLQAAGRVIRTETDRGVIVLIDDRFNSPIYKKSMPSLWKGLKFFADPKLLKAQIEKFWKSFE